ncbi:putative transport protein HsrA [compost metagenome]
MQLSMSLGVAVAAALLGGFGKPDATSVLTAFHATYLCVGAVTLLAAAIFFQLPPDSGRVVRRLEPDIDE